MGGVSDVGQVFGNRLVQASGESGVLMAGIFVAVGAAVIEHVRLCR